MGTIERQGATRRPGYRPGSGADGDDVTAPLLQSSNELTTVLIKADDGAARRWYQWVCSRASYALILLLCAYLLNQLDRYMLAITAVPLARALHYGDKACSVNKTAADNMTAAPTCNATSEASCDETAGCMWNYNGQGLEYQILAGPVFILVYTFAGIPVAFAADLYNRRNLLAGCLVLWSIATGLTGLVTQFWHLVLLRFLLGLGEAGCTPFAVSMLTDLFPGELRGLVVGIYNLGIYSGYSLSYALGNSIILANIFGQGWRWAFYVCGIPGIVLGVLILTTMSEPARREAKATVPAGDRATRLSLSQKLKATLRPFATFSLLLLCLGGSVRNAAGYVWAYNTQPYFTAVGQTRQQIASYMSWVPLVAGSIGVILGGRVSDLVAKKTGLIARVLVLVASQLAAAPFAAGTLYFSAPVSYIMQIPTYIIGEMWVGVALTVVVEMVQPQFKTSAIAVYLFIITNIGGTIPLLVPPVQGAFEAAGLSKVDALRGALYILYPCLYLGGGFLFLLTVFSLRRDKRQVGYDRLPEETSQPLEKD